MDKFVGQEDTAKPVEKDNAKSGSQDLKTEIAVVEVHQSFGDPKEVELHVPECLPCEYSSVHRDNRPSNACTACNITRPPRHRDSSRGYDNNVGVSHKTK